MPGPDEMGSLETRHPTGTVTEPAPPDTPCETCRPAGDEPQALASRTVTHESQPIHVCNACFLEVERDKRRRARA